MAGRDVAALRRCGLLGRAGLGGAVVKAPDQIGDVRELLLEVALVVLEPLEHVLARVPAVSELRAEPAAAVAVMVMTVHVHLPSKRRRNASTTTCVCFRALAQARRRSRPAGVSSYMRFAGPGAAASHSDVTSPSSSRARSTRYRPPSSGRSPGTSSATRSTSS